MKASTIEKERNTIIINIANNSFEKSAFRKLTSQENLYD